MVQQPHEDDMVSDISDMSELQQRDKEDDDDEDVAPPVPLSTQPFREIGVMPSPAPLAGRSPSNPMLLRPGRNPAPAQAAVAVERSRVPEPR